jgi:hypothetical protein
MDRILDAETPDHRNKKLYIYIYESLFDMVPMDVLHACQIRTHIYNIYIYNFLFL